MLWLLLGFFASLCFNKKIPKAESFADFQQNRCSYKFSKVHSPQASTQVNMSHHELAPANTNQYKSDTNQHESNTSQHESTWVRHEQRETTRARHESTRINTSLKTSLDHKECNVINIAKENPNVTYQRVFLKKTWRLHRSIV